MPTGTGGFVNLLDLAGSSTVNNALVVIWRERWLNRARLALPRPVKSQIRKLKRLHCEIQRRDGAEIYLYCAVTRFERDLVDDQHHNYEKGSNQRN